MRKPHTRTPDRMHGANVLLRRPCIRCGPQVLHLSTCFAPEQMCCSGGLVVSENYKFRNTCFALTSCLWCRFCSAGANILPQRGHVEQHFCSRSDFPEQQICSVCTLFAARGLNALALQAETAAPPGVALKVSSGHNFRTRRLTKSIRLGFVKWSWAI